MSTDLHPLILQKLDEFACRRRRLIVRRGVCAGLIALLGVMTIVAVVDRFVLLSDSVRWFLSAAGYLAALLGIWFTCVRLLRAEPDRTRLARLLELAQPELREDLLSAVELGNPCAQNEWESELFRKLLQEDVAGRIRELPIPEVLPWRLIQRWTRAAAATMVFCVFLFIVPGFHYGHLMLRALFPMANLERISSVRVEVREPATPRHVSPQGDDIAVVVAVSGPEPVSVVLETFQAGDSPQRTLMKSFGPREYTASIALGRKPVRYRILAGDAVTQKFLLESRPRPHVRKFEKTYHYPAYTGLSDRPVTEDHGNVAAIEGTEVRLMLEVDQPVREGELRIEQKGEQTRTRLKLLDAKDAHDPCRVQARLPILVSGNYRVHLVSLETSFENKFSPQYEIKALADLIPQVEIEKPREDLVLPPDELVTLQGNAKDDLALASVVQMVRVNDGDWSEVLLKEKPGKETHVVRDWDIAELKLNHGDHVTTKLVATDLKGNKGESAPVHIFIGSAGFDPQHLKALEARRRVQQSLGDLQKTTQELEHRVTEALAKTSQAGTDELLRKQAALSVMAPADEVEHEAKRALEEVKANIQSVSSERDASDLALVGRLLSALQREQVALINAEAGRAAEAKNPKIAQEHLKRAADSVAKASSLAKNANETFRDLLALEEASVAVRDLAQLVREQAQIIKETTEQAATHPQAWDRMARRENTLTREAKLVEDTLQALAAHSPPALAGPVAQNQQALQTARAVLEKTAAEKTQGPTLSQPASQFQKTLETAHGQLSNLQKELAQKTNQTRQLLAREAGRSASDLGRLRNEVEALALAQQKLAETRQKEKDAAKLETASLEIRKKADQTSDLWKATAERLEDRASLEERRGNADARFVADTGRLADAFRALRHSPVGPAADPQTAHILESLKNLEKSMQTLETAHNLEEASAGLQQLAEKERWEIPAPEEAVARAQDWNRLERNVEASQADAKEGRLPAPALETLNTALAGPDLARLRKEMTDRQTPGQSPVLVGDSADRLRSTLDEMRAGIEPSVQEARSAIGQAAPPLSEQAGNLAQAIKQTKTATADLAKNLSQHEPGQVRHELHKLLDSQQELNQQLEEMRDRLRRDAGAQNLFSEDGRQRSRDADDAVALLRETPPKTDDLLKQAAASPDAAEQERALDAATRQQDKSADALHLIAKHYENIGKGQVGETRTALRHAEEELGLKKKLDAEYERAKHLAGLADRSPEALMADLEKELKENDAMRRELSTIAKETEGQAQNILQEAIRQESEVSSAVKRLTEETVSQETALAEQAKKMGQEANRIAQEDLPALLKMPGPFLAETQAEIGRAKLAMERLPGLVPKDFSRSPEIVAKETSALSGPARDAESELKTAAEKTVKLLQAGQQQEARAGEETGKARAAVETAQQAVNKLAAEQVTLQQLGAKAEQKKVAAQQAAAHAAQQLAVAPTPEEKTKAQARADETRQALAKEEQTMAVARESVAKNAGEKAAADATLAKARENAAKTTQSLAQTQAVTKQLQAVQAKMLETADRTAKLAQQSRQMAENLWASADANQTQMNQFADKLPQVAEVVNNAADHLGRAERHETRLGRDEQSRTLTEIRGKLQNTANQELPQTEKKLSSAQRASDAKPVVDKTQESLEKQAAALTGVRARQADQTAAIRDSSRNDREASKAEARWTARALDRLDAALNANFDDAQANPSSPQILSGTQKAKAEALQAIAAASKSQVNAMRASRVTPPESVPDSTSPAVGRSPSSNSDGGAPVVTANSGGEPPPPVSANRNNNWGKLPPRIARDLLEAQHENVPAEYRNMVETYFRVIAEKAKEKNP